MDDRLATWSAAGAPGPGALTGPRVELQPLEAARHAAGLFAAAQGPGADPRLWDYLPYGPFPDAAAYAAWVAEHEASADPRFYAVVDRATGHAAGVVTLMSVDRANGSIEIGNVWFGAVLQRTPQATEAIALLARHAFDDLGHRRLEWKCDAANARSRAAAVRLGFTYEGTFRQHKIVKGRNRDTAWYSITDGEWPVVRTAFTAWLDPANFDPDGRQRASLAALRGGR